MRTFCLKDKKHLETYVEKQKQQQENSLNTSYINISEQSKVFVSPAGANLNFTFPSYMPSPRAQQSRERDKSKEKQVQECSWRDVPASIVPSKLNTMSKSSLSIFKRKRSPISGFEHDNDSNQEIDDFMKEDNIKIV